MAHCLALFASLAAHAAGGDPSGATPLPYQAPGKHLGVATCASSVCHGSVTSSTGHTIRLDEFVTWSHEDKHSQAYTALASNKGKSIASRLGIADARSEQVCLDCHSDNVPAPLRGSGFTPSDGVSCEACHGGADPWLLSHSSREATNSQNIARGMYPTARLHERAALCLSCHLGNGDKFATHRILGAGHPRLSFELDTFLALEPPHYQTDADYAKRKPTYPRVQVWAYGQLAAAQKQLEILQGPLVSESSFVPELALLDCHACHENPLHSEDWSRGLLTRLVPPGAVPFADGYLKMAWLITRRIDAGTADAMLSQIQTLQRASAQRREQVVAASAQLTRSIAHTISAADTHPWSRDDVAGMMLQIVEMGASGEYRDYISAEQAVMAIELLMIDLGTASQHRKTLDAMYGMLRNDDAYRPAQMRETMASLAVTLRQQRPEN